MGQPVFFTGNSNGSCDLQGFLLVLNYEHINTPPGIPPPHIHGWIIIYRNDRIVIITSNLAGFSEHVTPVIGAEYLHQEIAAPQSRCMELEHLGYCQYQAEHSLSPPPVAAGGRGTFGEQRG